MDVKIKTLTPLWTGGVSGKVDRIHETGILGSLRWWYEAIVRGLGGKACDPSEGKCCFDADKYKQSKEADERQRLREAGLCDVCQVFGATGWRRRFRLHVHFAAGGVSDASISDTICLKGFRYEDNTRTLTWYFRDPSKKPNTPKEGSFNIKIQSLDSHFSAEVIAGLIQFVADWAALGARAQMGFGVTELQNGRIDTRPLYDWLDPVVDSHLYPNLPSLRNIFLARILNKNGEPFKEEDTFNLKYDLRQLFKKDSNLRHFIMGKVKNKERIAAKIKMSRPYNDKREMRVWGWIPEKVDVYQSSGGRNKVLVDIHQHLKANYSLEVWRELNSSRDTVLNSTGDIREFLKSLLT
jgi:CRISPR-associated protein Cmr1